MIKSSVTINLVTTLKSGPWVFWQSIENSIKKAAELGFSGVELFPASAQSLDSLLFRDLLKRFRVELSAVGTGAGKVLKGLTLTNPDASIRKEAMNFIRELIELGASFGAPAIIGSMQGNIANENKREESLRILAEYLANLGEIARQYGTFLLYEPLNRYETNIINNLDEAVSFLEVNRLDNVCLLADLFHMNIEEESVCGSISKHAAYIKHFHFADTNRRPVGNGHLPMAEISDAIIKSGYSGYISAEAFPWPDEDEAARQTITAFRKYFKV